MEKKIDFIFKVIIIGDSSVEKEKMLYSYVDDKKIVQLFIEILIKILKLIKKSNLTMGILVVKKYINQLLALIIKKL